MASYWFISTKYRRHSKLALFTFMLAFVVILLGAYTRLTDAGLSCPDWPHCFGFITAPHTFDQLSEAAKRYPSVHVDIKKAWTEMTHRYFAGTEGLLIFFLCVSMLMHRQMKDKKTVMIAVMLIALVGVQVILGMLTVTEKLKPVIVLGHLVTGLTLLCTLWWTYLDLHLQDDHFGQSTRVNLFWCWLALVIVAGQIILGGWVSTHYADLACIDFPYCNGQLLPALHLRDIHNDLVTIHMLHRIGAIITALYLGIFSLILLTKPSFRPNAVLILALVALQITLGILNIVWLRPVSIALLHHTVAILLLLAVLTILIKASLIAVNRHGSWLS